MAARLHHDWGCQLVVTYLANKVLLESRNGSERQWPRRYVHRRSQRMSSFCDVNMPSHSGHATALARQGGVNCP